MKKLLKRNKKVIQAPARITNETVAEHREKILSGGRRFKYPHQYLRHKLVINTIVIATITLAIASLGIWWMLYKAQSTNDLSYRITRALPLPVARVGNENVLYSDYLMRFRSSEKYLKDTGQIGVSAEDEKTQLTFYKKDALGQLIKDMYAQKIAHERNISVSNEEVDQVIASTREALGGQISEDVYNASVQTTLGYSPDEYRRLIKQQLLRQKVAYAVDDNAKMTSDSVGSELSSKPKTDLQAFSSSLKKKNPTIDFGASGLVPKNNTDGGLTKAALSLKVGEISTVLRSTTGDGYYYIQRLSGSGSKVSYQYIRIPLTVFDKDFQQFLKSGEVTKFIFID